MATSTPSLVTGVVNQLKARLPALVAAEGLPPVMEFLNYDPGLLQPGRSPQVFVDLSEVRPGGPAQFGGTNASWTRLRRVLIGVTCAGEDAGVAASRLYTFTDLILKAMTQDLTAMGEGHNVRWMGTAYGPNMAGNGVALFRLAMLTFEITRWGTLGED